MAYQMTITLTDDEYSALQAEATLTGKLIEELLHERIAPRMKPEHSLQIEDTALHKLYSQGILMNIATKKPLTVDEDELLQQLALKLGVGQPLSEMVIEDRGLRD